MDLYLAAAYKAEEYNKAGERAFERRLGGSNQTGPSGLQGSVADLKRPIEAWLLETPTSRVIVESIKRALRGKNIDCLFSTGPKQALTRQRSIILL